MSDRSDQMDAAGHVRRGLALTRAQDTVRMRYASEVATGPAGSERQPLVNSEGVIDFEHDASDFRFRVQPVPGMTRTRADLHVVCVDGTVYVEKSAAPGSYSAHEVGAEEGGSLTSSWGLLELLAGCIRADPARSDDAGELVQVYECELSVPERPERGRERALGGFDRRALEASGPIPARVWLNADGLVLRMVAAMPDSIFITIDLSEFGLRTKIRRPPEKKVRRTDL